MHNPESVQQNETHKDLWDFEIQTDLAQLGGTVEYADYISAEG